MDGKSTNLIEVSIKQKKNTLTGRLNRAGMYAQFKVLEILAEEDKPLYMLFYKDSLVYGGEISQETKGSFIEQTFRSGTLLEFHHPGLQLIAPQKPLTIPNRNKLFPQLHQHYSPHETASIITTLDSFFDKEQLIEQINEIYSQLKRDGKHFKAYRVLRILKEFVPESTAVQNQFHSLEFHYFHDIYTADLSTLHEKDPLTFEQYCFENRFKSNEQTLLLQEWKGQNRQLDSLLLWLETGEEHPSTQSIREYTNTALQNVSMGSWIQILSYAKINPFNILPESKSWLEEMVNEGEYEKAANALLPFINNLPDHFESMLETVWANLNAPFIANHLDELIPALEQMGASENGSQFNQLLSNLVSNLLQGNELSTVQQKLAPIKKRFPHSTTIRKIDHMAEISEDPESMMQLGQYYAEFKQYDPAIECFSMEMEFHPDEADPIWQLS
ncbi:MAG TPA: hypothetical protein VFT51_11005, partial [Bacillales bacterium]|nr:hypothetical protein [Bacillales bacterium]